MRKRDDIGITNPGLEAGEHGHRLFGLRVEIGGLEPFIAVSAYLQAGVGLNALNLTLLSTLAQWQEQLQLPLLGGCDFNVPPQTIGKTDFTARSGMWVVPPRAATYKTSTAAAEIDY